MSRLMVVAVMTLIIGGALATESEVDPKTKALKTIEEAEKAYANINDYTAVFERQERIEGELLPPEHFFLKFKKPFCIYIKWLDEGPRKGMELIYVIGKYNDKVLVHAAGLADVVMPTAELDVSGEIAMKGNRHPITKCGIGYFLERYARDFRKADAANEMEVFYQGERLMDGRRAHEIEVYLHPRRADHGYYCYRSVVYFDVKNKLPIRMLFYDWDNRLLESYAYKDLKVNCGLTLVDFDPKNKEYNFGLFPLRPPARIAEVPVSRVMRGCDWYRTVVRSSDVEIVPFIKTKKERTYYVGYDAKHEAPRVMATDGKTKWWLGSLRFLVGVERDGAGFCITDVVVLNRGEIGRWERRLLTKDGFLRQFSGKNAKDTFAVGRDVSSVSGAAAWAKGCAAGIKSTVDALLKAFEDKELLAAAKSARKVDLRGVK